MVVGAEVVGTSTRLELSEGSSISDPTNYTLKEYCEIPIGKYMNDEKKLLFFNLKPLYCPPWRDDSQNSGNISLNTRLPSTDHFDPFPNFFSGKSYKK